MLEKFIILLIFLIGISIETDSFEGEEILNDEELLEEHKDDFLDFQRRYHRTCIDGTATCQARKRHFASNMRRLNQLRRENRSGLDYGLSRFMDWSPVEIRKMLIPKERMRRNQHRALKLERNMWAEADRTLAQYPGWDWRTRGAVNPVRDQLNCGSCWAFAALAAIEVQFNNRRRTYNAKRYKFSDQFIVDCDTSNWGCNGGYPERAMRFTKTVGVIPQAAYPYRGRRGTCQKAKFPAAKRIRPIKGVQMLTRNIPAMINFIRYKGPVAAGFWVCDDFMFYRSGIYKNQHCNGVNALGGHAMAIIGYGSDNGRPYWLLRNQWGTNWGINGYIKMARGVNTCAIESWGVSAPLF